MEQAAVEREAAAVETAMVAVEMVWVEAETEQAGVAMAAEMGATARVVAGTAREEVGVA